MKMIARVLIFCLLSVTIGLAAGSMKVTGIQASYLAGGTQVTFNLTQAPKYHIFTLANPARAVLDLEQTTLAAPLPKFSNQSSVKDVRTSQNNQKLRFVFDLKSKQSVHTQLTQKAPYKLILTLSSANTKATKAAASTKNTVKSASKSVPQTIAKPAPLPTPQFVAPQSNTGRDVIVVIDPGHGGKDPGTRSKSGVREKDVVLAISKDLQVLINQQPGMKATLTRKGDYYLTLRQRLQVARNDKADIFVAIHADAFKDPDAEGASVFALSERGATSEAARWLAEKENYSELGGVNLEDKNYVLRSVLLDLSQTATIGASLDLGLDVLQSIGTFAPLHADHVEQARFVVLKSPDIPSILIETGFLSNPKQAALLRSPKYQKKMAQSIMEGIKAYFYQNPPPGTWFEAHRKDAKRYRVSPGDTLTSIAMLYQVPTSALKKANNLKGNQVEIGQVLQIP